MSEFSSKFNFVSAEHCEDYSKKLDTLEIRGTIAPITDFAILLGGYVSDDYHYNNSNSLEDRAGKYWTCTCDKESNTLGVFSDGFVYPISTKFRNYGGRPTISYDIPLLTKLSGVRRRDGIIEVEYGEYPQKVASKRLQDELERAYLFNQFPIMKTGKTYTIDSIRICSFDSENKKFNPRTIEEYLYNEKKYVRVRANLEFSSSKIILSNGEEYKNEDYVWVEVQPIKWLYSAYSTSATLLSERILFAGVQFNCERNYWDYYLRGTDIKVFMDKYFSKDIIPSKIDIKTKKNTTNKEEIQYTFAFLTKEQVVKDSTKKLKILEKRGTIAPITDFAILLGGYAFNSIYYNNSNSLEDRVGVYFTCSELGADCICIVSEFGTEWHSSTSNRYCGARPALSYSSIRNNCSNIVRKKDGVLEVEYGEYPQKVVSKRLQNELEKAYNYNNSFLKKTGKTYTTDSRRCNEEDAKFSPQTIEEYLYNEKKYVRVKANFCFGFYGRSKITLSNGEEYKNEEYKDKDYYVWVEVGPIKWLIDEKSNIALSERILFAGVQFNHEENYKGDFKTTDIQQFMDRYFSKDIISSKIDIKTEEEMQPEIDIKTEEEMQPEIDIKTEEEMQPEIDIKTEELIIDLYHYRNEKKNTTNKEKIQDPFTFLTTRQCFNSYGSLKAFKKRGNIAKITDFAVLLGGKFRRKDDFFNNYSSNEGYYWTCSEDGNNDAYVVGDWGCKSYCVYHRFICARPALPYSLIHDISLNEVREKNGILEVEYGEYPQYVAFGELQYELEDAYNYNQSSIIETGKTYTTDSRRWDEEDAKFSPQIIKEYLYNGKKYVRVKANNSHYDGHKFVLSDGKTYRDGDYVWVEVEPIKWLIDEKNNIAFTERLLFAGVQFNFESNYKGNFNTTDIKKFMDKYFSKDIIPSKIKKNITNMDINSKKMTEIILDSERNGKKIELRIFDKNNSVDKVYTLKK